MDNLDDIEIAKVSDSAYSNSCSNSQSRRSRSSKSTHSGSNSSGSSGYRGKPSTSGSSNDIVQPPEKRCKEDKRKKKKSQTHQEHSVSEVIAEADSHKDEASVTENAVDDKIYRTEAVFVEADRNVDVRPAEETNVVPHAPSEDATALYKDDMDISPQESAKNEDGFACIVSMNDGVVLFATATLTSTLGYPRDMWIGRSFIDFVHPKDQNTFAAQITYGLALPKNVNKVQVPSSSVCSMFCRIRRYRGLAGAGFSVRERVVTFIPFLIKLSFKNINEDDGSLIYLVVQATPIFSAFKMSNEVISKDVPFIIRHVANGKLDYIDPESVPYLGYLPQDMTDNEVLQYYHPEDLPYLKQVYETIMKEGSMPRSKSFRMLAQNGDYITMESEWSSFVNPWSKKLEFVVGKHYVKEGPANPDVFQSPDPAKVAKMTDDDKKNVRTLQNSIIRMMGESLSKPPEVAKQLMSKRCHDLASFMESLMEDQPKNDEELRLEIQDLDHSYFDRDSVMLGGISPHHDYSDSKSSVETPLSYNQLNYKENLQRYFDSHQPFSYEDYNNVTGVNILGIISGSQACNRLSPVAYNSAESMEQTSSGESSCPVDKGSQNASSGGYQPCRLTETLLSRHNSDMENVILMRHRENRSTNKGERQILSNEKRKKKKKEHLARCNASFQPTATPGPSSPVTMGKPRGVKRTAKDTDTRTHKLLRLSSITNRARLCTSSAPTHHSSTITTTIAPHPWANNTPVTSMNTFISGIPGISQQISIMNPVAALPPPMPYMMYGQAVFGSPLLYSAMSTQVTFPVQQNLIQTMQYNTAQSSIDFTSSSYKESRKIPAMTSSISSESKTNQTNTRQGGSEENVDRTDGESSYSSFYSSFFKTECGSGEDSDPKKQRIMKANNNSTSPNKPEKQILKTKMDPPWLEQASLTSELMYKYQIPTKGVEEVLSDDRQKMSNLEQPSLVNEQLGQLYLDLQLEGVAARLTLEEGITSSGSSGEETSTSFKGPRRKREYSKLVMIYEEDAPLPPPPEGEAKVAILSTIKSEASTSQVS